jgi:hypothetical protein
MAMFQMMGVFVEFERSMIQADIRVRYNVFQLSIFSESYIGE